MVFDVDETVRIGVGMNRNKYYGIIFPGRLDLLHLPTQMVLFIPAAYIIYCVAMRFRR